MIFSKDTPPDLGTGQTSNAQASENTRILALIAQDYLKDRKSKRRWGVLIKMLVLGYVAATAWVYFQSTDPAVDTEHTALVEIDGVIGPGENSAELINESLANAFAAPGARGVVIKINSPGGTPVQAAQINEEITRLKGLHPDKPVYVAITDICASGGYYIAVAADQIYAHPASIVGSIGVLMNGFGFTGTMEKLGIERRLITAGSNKGMLDPFSPVNAAQQRHAESMLADVHAHFIDAVRQGRGDRLDPNPEIFSGLFWSGKQARELGLVDEFGSADTIAREVVGAAKIIDYTARLNFVDRLARQMGASIGNVVFSKLLQIQ